MHTAQQSAMLLSIVGSSASIYRIVLKSVYVCLRNYCIRSKQTIGEGSFVRTKKR